MVLSLPRSNISVKLPDLPDSDFEPRVKLRLINTVVLTLIIHALTLNDAGGGIKMTRWVRIRLVCLQFSSKLLNFFLVKADINCHLLRLLATFWGKLRMIEIGPCGRRKRSSIFQSLHPSQKNMLPKANDQKKKKTICKIFHQKKISEILMKIEEMADVLRHMHF